MTAYRASAAALAAVLLAPALPASAQVADDIVLQIMRQCARIDDATARLACYDNNIRSGAGQSIPAVPGAMARPQAAPGAPASTSGISGFGREDVQTEQRFQAPAGELEQIRARVSAVAQREPGIYLVTLEDGAQWLFSESVSFSYRPPRAGSSVEIERAAMDSFLLRFDNQQSVRVRRLR